MTADEMQQDFRRTKTTIRRLLVARLGNTGAADELLSRMQARVERQAVRVAGDPSTFLLRLANELATEQRIATRRSVPEPWRGSEHDAEAMYRTDESEPNVLRKVISMMPEPMSTAVRLFRLDGLSEPAIADRLRVDVKNVRMMLLDGYRMMLEERPTPGSDGVGGSSEDRDTSSPARR